MSGNNTPHGLQDWMAEMERRLRDLETAPRARRTGQVGGRYVVLDDDENERVILGELVDPISGATRYGIQMIDQSGNVEVQIDDNVRIYDDAIPQNLRIELGKILHPTTAAEDHGIIVTNPAGEEVFALGDAGLIYPAQEGKQANPGVGRLMNDSLNVWAAAWRWYFAHVVSDAIHIDGDISVGVGISSAEAKLEVYTGAGLQSTSSIRSLTTGGSFVGYAWNWLHTLDVDPTEKILVQILVRRTGGAGTIDVADHKHAYQADADQLGATSAGF